MFPLNLKCTILCAFLILPLLSRGETIPLDPVKKPNITIVPTDDRGYGDLGYHDNPYIKTPHLDTFAASALELTYFHAGTTCATTRAGITTGSNENRNNIWNSIAGCSILLEDEETIVELFSNNAYKTTMFGKWHWGDNYPFRPHDRGFDNAFYHGGGVNQTPDFWNNDYFDDTYFRNGTTEKTNVYCTDVWFDEAIAYIGGSTKKAPFFMYLAMNEAHSPFNVPEEYRDIYNDVPLAEIQKRFYGMITNIDDNFDWLVSHHKETGLFDNTIIIFTTDNGTALGVTKDDNVTEYGFNVGLRGVKGGHYDRGHKAPFFMSRPDGDILQKDKIGELTAYVGLLADFARLAYRSKKPLDGASIADILRGREKSLKRTLIIATQSDQLPEKGRNRCVTTTDRPLIDGKELYRTIEDASQKNVVANEHPDIVMTVQAEYDLWWKSIETDIRYAEIPIGNTTERPVLITVHDMHTVENISWNQEQVREAKFATQRYYSIKVVHDRNYRLKLNRYPPESKLSLNAQTPEIKGTDFLDTLPKGEIIHPIEVKISLGETQLESKVDGNLTFATLETALTKGSYRLEGKFIDSAQHYFQSYYIETTKIP